MADKNTLAQVLLAKVEGAYAVAPTVTGSTDAVLFIDNPDYTISYAYDGKRPAAPGTAGMMKGNQASGRTASYKFSVEGKGLGAAYTSTGSVVPSLHAHLLASGLSGSYAAGAWTFVPSAPVPGILPSSSVYMEGYTGAEKWVLTGGVSTFSINIANAAAPLFEFDGQALMPAVPVDAAYPNYTYINGAVMPPKGDALGVTFGAYTPKVRSVKFDLGRKIEPLLDINSAAGHAGFIGTTREPKLTMVVEASSLASFDPYTAASSGSVYSLTMNVGGAVTGNKIQLNLPQAQLDTVKRTVSNRIVTWELTFLATTTLPNTSDDLSLVLS